MYIYIYISLSLSILVFPFVFSFFLSLLCKLYSARFILFFCSIYASKLPLHFLSPIQTETLIFFPFLLTRKPRVLFGRFSCFLVYILSSNCRPVISDAICTRPVFFLFLHRLTNLFCNRSTSIGPDSAANIHLLFVAPINDVILQPFSNSY